MSNLFKSKQTIQKEEKAVQYKRGELFTFTKEYLHKSFFVDTLPIKVSMGLTKDADGKSTYLEFVGSDTKVDFDGDRLTLRALHGMNSTINNSPGALPLLFGHKNIRLGQLVGSTIDKDQQLWIRAKLDPTDLNPAAHTVLRQIQNGQSFGFSVGGVCEKRQNARSLKEIVKVELAEVSMVDTPANARAE